MFGRLTVVSDATLSDFNIEQIGDRVFQNGCTATLLNVHVQQRRAFKFIQELSKTDGLIKPGDRVAVVGAAITGLTVATSLNVLKAKVTLFESANGLSNNRMAKKSHD